MRKVLVSLGAFLAVFSPSIEIGALLPTAEARANETSETLIASFTETQGTPSPNDIFDLVNAEREKAGLKALQPSELLMQVAKQRARDMQINSYYAHEDPGGNYYYDQLDGSRYDNTYSCENLDLRFSISPEGYVTDWLGSPSHRRCMLHQDTTHAGYAAVKLDRSSKGRDIASYIVVAIHAAD